MNKHAAENARGAPSPLRQGTVLTKSQASNSQDIVAVAQSEFSVGIQEQRRLARPAAQKARYYEEAHKRHQSCDGDGTVGAELQQKLFRTQNAFAQSQQSPFVRESTTRESENSQVVAKFQSLERACARIFELFESQGVARFHQELFAHSTAHMDADALLALLKRECNLIRENRCSYQLCTQVIRQREGIVLRLRLAMRDLQRKDPVAKESALKECCILLCQLREVSVRVTESIFAWRNELISHHTAGQVSEQKESSQQQQQQQQQKSTPFREQDVVFLHNQSNYLARLRTDCIFLSTSALSNFVPFSTKCDPFFVYAYKRLKKQADSGLREDIMNLAKIDDDLKQRIRVCEKLLAEQFDDAHTVRTQVLPAAHFASYDDNQGSKRKEYTRNSQEASPLSHKRTFIAKDNKRESKQASHSVDISRQEAQKSPVAQQILLQQRKTKFEGLLRQRAPTTDVRFGEEFTESLDRLIIAGSEGLRKVPATSEDVPQQTQNTPSSSAYRKSYYCKMHTKKSSQGEQKNDDDKRQQLQDTLLSFKQTDEQPSINMVNQMPQIPVGAVAKEVLRPPLLDLKLLQIQQKTSSLLQALRGSFDRVSNITTDLAASHLSLSKQSNAQYSSSQQQSSVYRVRARNVQERALKSLLSDYFAQVRDTELAALLIEDTVEKMHHVMVTELNFSLLEVRDAFENVKAFAVVQREAQSLHLEYVGIFQAQDFAPSLHTLLHFLWRHSDADSVELCLRSKYQKEDILEVFARIGFMYLPPPEDAKSSIFWQQSARSERAQNSQTHIRLRAMRPSTSIHASTDLHTRETLTVACFTMIASQKMETNIFSNINAVTQAEQSQGHTSSIQRALRQSLPAFHYDATLLQAHLLLQQSESVLKHLKCLGEGAVQGDAQLRKLKQLAELAEIVKNKQPKVPELKMQHFASGRALVNLVLGAALIHCHTRQLQVQGIRYEYFRLRFNAQTQGSTELLFKQNSAQPLLILPTRQAGVRIFITDASEFVTSEGKDTHLFVQNFLNEALTRKTLDREVWIPMFIKKRAMGVTTALQNVTLKGAKKFFESFELSLFKGFDFLGGKMVANEPIAGRSVVLKAPFIFGVLLATIEVALPHTPAVSCLVTEDDLVRSGKDFQVF